MSPKPTRCVPVIMPGRNSAFCAAVPKRNIMITVGKLPIIEISDCGSLCRPIGMRLRCSRTIAIARFEPPRPPSSSGSA